MAAGAGIAGMVQVGAGVLAGAGAAVGTEVRITAAGITGMVMDITIITPIQTAEEAIMPIAVSEETTTATEAAQQEATEAIMLTTLLQEGQMRTIQLETLQDIIIRQLLVLATAAQPLQEIITRRETAIILRETAVTTIIALQHEAITLREVKT